MNDTEYYEVLRRRPFGWKYADPQSFESYSFEKIDPFAWHDWLEVNWKWSYYAGAAYICAIFAIKEYMKNRPALELKGPLFIWNMSLGIFSIIGFARTLPDLVHILLQPDGFYHSICTKEGINVPCVYWGLLFAMSKFWELGDTIFIVLRKRRLVFLQWYHHLVTLWVVWTVAPLVEPIVRWYGTLNYGVHSLMYPYFALKTIGVKVPSKIAYIITTLQLAQMVIGFSVNMASLFLQQSGYSCVRYPVSIRAFNLVYGSFIILFGKLFYESVLLSGRKSRAKSKKQE